MKLLVPIDGSYASVNALKKALEIAKKYDFSIKLVTVFEAGHLLDYERNDNFWHQVDGSIISHDAVKKEPKTAKAEDKAAALLADIISKLDFSGIDVEKEVLEGEPAEAILAIAENEKFDLIVMGNRGMSKMKRFFTGSVTQRVIAEAPCPVLAIHTGVKS